MNDEALRFLTRRSALPPVRHREACEIRCEQLNCRTEGVWPEDRGRAATSTSRTV